MKKEELLKEKIKLALTSTYKVISQDQIKPKVQTLDNKSVEALNKDSDSLIRNFEKLRAEFDSSALKLRYSDEQIFKNNFPKKNCSTKFI